MREISFSNTSTVGAEIWLTWEFLRDVGVAAHCLPGCTHVEAIEAGRSFRITARRTVGPFKVWLVSELTVIEETPPRRLRLEIKGTDKRLKSLLEQTLSVELAEEAAGGTRITTEGTARLGGLIGTLAQPLIRAHMEAIIEEFGDALCTEIERRSASSSPAEGVPRSEAENKSG